MGCLFKKLKLDPTLMVRKLLLALAGLKFHFKSKKMELPELLKWVQSSGDYRITRSLRFRGKYLQQKMK